MGVPAADVLAVSYSHFGHPYSLINRFGPNNYDCSGHVKATMNWFGLPFPTTSSTQWSACQKIALAEALITPGSLIFRPENPLRGLNALGHVAFSLGNGWTSEARGRAYGVGSWPIGGRGFSSHAGLIPGVDYQRGGVAPNIGAIIKQFTYLTMLAVSSGPALAVWTFAKDGYVYQGDEVAAWQNALNLAFHAGVRNDGAYDDATARATANFQRAYNAFAGYAAVPAFGLVDADPHSKTRAAMVQALSNLLSTI